MSIFNTISEYFNGDKPSDDEVTVQSLANDFEISEDEVRDILSKWREHTKPGDDSLNYPDERKPR